MVVRNLIQPCFRAEGVQRARSASDFACHLCGVTVSRACNKVDYSHSFAFLFLGCLVVVCEIVA